MFPHISVHPDEVPLRVRESQFFFLDEVLVEKKKGGAGEFQNLKKRKINGMGKKLAELDFRLKSLPLYFSGIIFYHEISSKYNLMLPFRVQYLFQRYNLESDKYSYDQHAFLTFNPVHDIRVPQ